VQKKSQFYAAAFTLFFGPLGLFYISVSQAFLAIALSIPVLFWAAAASHTGSTVLIVFWLVLIAVAVSMTRKHNRIVMEKEDLDERRHQEVVNAARGGVRGR